MLADQHIPLGDRAGPPPGARYLTAAPITHAAGTKVLPVLSRGGTVHLRPGASVTAEELIRHVRQRKGAVQAPKAIRIVDALPTTSVGKIDKRALHRLDRLTGRDGLWKPWKPGSANIREFI